MTSIYLKTGKVINTAEKMQEMIGSLNNEDKFIIFVDNTIKEREAFYVVNKDNIDYISHDVE